MPVQVKDENVEDFEYFFSIKGKVTGYLAIEYLELLRDCVVFCLGMYNFLRKNHQFLPSFHKCMNRILSPDPLPTQSVQSKTSKMVTFDPSLLLFSYNIYYWSERVRNPLFPPFHLNLVCRLVEIIVKMNDFHRNISMMTPYL